MRIVAYTYRADLLCPRCTCQEVMVRKLYYSRHEDTPVEEYLDGAAQRYGIDREDEASFDSMDFPKVVFRDQLDDEHGACDACGEELT